MSDMKTKEFLRERYGETWFKVKIFPSAWETLKSSQFLIGLAVTGFASQGELMASRWTTYSDPVESSDAESGQNDRFEDARDRHIRETTEVAAFLSTQTNDGEKILQQDRLSLKPVPLCEDCLKCSPGWREVVQRVDEGTFEFYDFQLPWIKVVHITESSHRLSGECACVICGDTASAMGYLGVRFSERAAQLDGCF